MKSNYHSHVDLCRHASGTSEEHILEAIRLGYDIIGISDHAPLITINGVPSEYTYLHRMRLEELNGYISNLRALKTKYESQIDILIGLETEYFESHIDYLKDLRSKVDYLAFGNHDLIVNGRNSSSFTVRTNTEALEYGNNAVRGMSTGLYSFMTHPDLYLISFEWGKIAEKVCRLISEASIKYDCALEFNANGIRRGKVNTNEGLRYLFPRKEFWAIVREYDCKVIVNSDAHNLKEHNDLELHEARRLAKEWDLNVISKLEI